LSNVSICRVVTNGQESSSGPSILYETTGVTSSMRYSGLVPANDVSNMCCFDFECYEVTGRLTFEFSPNSDEAAASFLLLNEVMLLAFVKAFGRRCYEFYRGSRSKKQLVEEMQKVSALEAELNSLR
jgi:hypothetical protein